MTGLSDCRILLNGPTLNKDGYRTGTCDSLVCEREQEEDRKKLLYICFSIVINTVISEVSYFILLKTYALD